MEALVLPVGDAFHAVALDSVREVVPVVPVAAVPDAPAWLRGLANLRGSILPVVDSAAAFGAGQLAGATHLVLVDTAAGPAAVLASGTPTPAVLGDPAGVGDRPGAIGRYAVDERVATLVDLDELCGAVDR